MSEPKTVAVADLARYRMFQDLEPAEIVAFLKTARVRTYGEDRKAIFSQGEQGDGMYIVLAGEVDIFTTDNAGRRHLLGTLAEGDFFGEMALVEDKPRAASAEARGHDARLVFLSRDAFFQLRSADAAVLNKILLRMMSEMSARLRGLGQRYMTSKAMMGF